MTLSEINSRIKENILRFVPETADAATGVSDFSIHRRDSRFVPENCLYRPLVTLTVQGKKRSALGGESGILRPNQYLVSTIDMPASNYVLEASPEKPFLSITLNLNKFLISELTAELSAFPPRGNAPQKSFGIADADPALLDAFFRLSNLLNAPDEIRVLAPMIVREIHFRLLRGPLGGLIAAVGTPGSADRQIARAILHLRKNFARAVKIEELAARAHLSPASFHRHFKKMTTLSPMQYQKRLRLFEAQRLMLVENRTAYAAAYAVGYESPTQFSREYKRMFGVPPRADIARHNAPAQ